MDKPYFCKNCDNYGVEGFSSVCKREATIVWELVQGSQSVENSKRCSTERSENGTCGPQGIFFRKKRNWLVRRLRWLIYKIR